MRIAFVTPRYLPSQGGVETHVSRLAQEIVRAGHEVTVLTEETDRSRRRREVIEGVAIHRFPVLLPSPAYPFAPALWNHLRRLGVDYDVVHAHNYHAFPALGAALFASQSLVFTPHYHGTGHRPLGKLMHNPYRMAGRLIFNRAKAVICVSHAEAKLVSSNFPVAPERLVVIPNGVDAAAIQNAEPYPEEDRIVLSVGRLVDYKHVDRLIQAVSLVGDVKLIIIGDGPARARLEALAAELQLERRVRFLGRVDQVELYKWYRTACVYASLSSDEAFGLTVLEGLMGGAQVVASDIPAHREALTPETDGATLVPLSMSTDALAEVLARKAAQGRQVEVEGAFPSWKDVAEKTLEAYRAVKNVR